METVGGIPMVKRVWLAARKAMFFTPHVSERKVIVAWPERYPDLDQNNVLERFRRISKEFPSEVIIRLTADCPLLTNLDIMKAVNEFHIRNKEYYSNHLDGHDVQVFTPKYLFSKSKTHIEHVIKDFSTKSTGLSVNTKKDLERVRKLCEIK